MKCADLNLAFFSHKVKIIKNKLFWSGTKTACGWLGLRRIHDSVDDVLHNGMGGSPNVAGVARRQIRRIRRVCIRVDHRIFPLNRLRYH